MSHGWYTNNYRQTETKRWRWPFLYFLKAFSFFPFVRLQDDRQQRVGRWHAAPIQTNDTAKTLRVPSRPAEPWHVIFSQSHRCWDKTRRVEWHAPATRSCAGRQTSVQWHPPHECLVGARTGDRGCHCSLWSQPSWVNLADREYKYI